MTTALVLGLAVLVGLLLPPRRRSKERWHVRAAELHGQWLERSLAFEGWEPFAFVERPTSVPGKTREGVPADRLNGYVLLRRRSREAPALSEEEERRGLHAVET